VRERNGAKAHRLLTTGCVRVERADERTALVEVEGDHGRYRVEVDDTAALCTCPSWGICSHGLAALLVARRRPAA
jgi:uncharacterized Zn finger protein